MRRIILVTALTTSALAAPSMVNAQLYTSAEVGGVKAQKMKYDVTGLGVGVNDILDVKQKWGIDVDATLGYDFHGFRVEVESGYKRTKIDQLRFNLAGVGNTPYTSDVGGRTRTADIMLNGYVDLPLGRFTPFLGGGAGIANVDSSIAAGGTELFRAKDWGFAWQAMGGAKYKLSNRFDVTAKYKYFNVPKVRYDLGAGAQFKTALHTHSALLGITYYMGDRDVAAPPPPPPPPPPPEPAPAPAPEAPSAFVVFFDWNKSVITAEAASILDNAAAAFASTGRASVQLSGHTDTSGSASYNMRLSKRRADAAKAYLIGKGVPQNVIETMAYGETKPLVVTQDNVREPQNRRVEILFGPGSGQ